MTAAHRPDDMSRGKVLALVMAGVTQDIIGDVLGISSQTVRIHYRNELDNGMANANALVARNIYALCVQGNLGALIFWAKTRMGWRETGEINIRIGHDVDGMDPVETFRNRIEAMRERSLAAIEVEAVVIADGDSVTSENGTHANETSS